MILTHVITADTRTGWLADHSVIGAYGSVNLCGCRSVDFLTHGVVAKNRYLDSPLITERRTVLCVDVHKEIPDDVSEQISKLRLAGEITHVILTPHHKDGPRWNDKIYLRALDCVDDDSDLVAKWDGDTIGYRRPDVDVLATMLGDLNSGHAYVCQQTPLSKEDHKMSHASTRFFLARRTSLDLVEADRLLDDRTRVKKFPGQHLPCLEHILGAMSGDKVFYPPSQFEDHIVFSWVRYYRGLIEHLNGASYAEVYDYIFNKCGGVHGASDFVALPL